MSVGVPASVRQMGIDTVRTDTLPPKYEIIGNDMQVLRIHMDAGDKVVAEPGAMVYMHSDVKAGCDAGDCCGRCVSGSPCVMGTFEAGGSGAYLGLTPVRPAKVLPLDLRGRRFLGKDRAYFASVGDVKINYDVDTNPLTCCCGGQGLIRQVIEGDGTAFIGAMGVITHKTLAEGETLVVDTTSVVAWEDTVTFAVKKTGGCLTCCCAGEGMFNTTLQGPGDVYVQSYSYGKFKQYAETWALQNKLGGAGGDFMTEGGAAFGGAPPAADALAAPTVADVVLGEVVALDDVRRRGVPVAAAKPIDRKSL